MNKRGLSSKTWWIIAIIVAIVILLIILVRGSVTGKAPGQSNWNACGDRIDNDGDGRCDYIGSKKSCTDGSIKGDSGCSSLNDNFEESCVAGSTTCGVGACQRSSTCINDQVSCTPGSPGTETCNNVDDNCNGQTDEGGVCTPADSCNDTDGGIVANVNGSVSGYKNGTPYSYFDNCVNNVTLTEYYCIGTGAHNGTINCATNITTECIVGRCL